MGEGKSPFDTRANSATMSLKTCLPACKKTSICDPFFWPCDRYAFSKCQSMGKYTVSLPSPPVQYGEHSDDFYSSAVAFHDFLNRCRCNVGPKILADVTKCHRRSRLVNLVTNMFSRTVWLSYCLLKILSSMFDSSRYFNVTCAFPVFCAKFCCRDGGLNNVNK